MRLGERAQGIIYRAGAMVILGVLRIPLLSDALSSFAKVWLRHRRIFRHLQLADYDQVIDGGANVGEFAALVRGARPSAKLICVEPHPVAAAVLRRRGFDVVEAALWNAQGTAILRQPGKATTSATLMDSSAGGDSGWPVRTIRLDDLPLVGSRILVKLDLQGAELRALEGLGQAWSRICAILLEVSYGPGGTREELSALLEGRGFREAATLNELDVAGLPVEGDKLWLRSVP